MTEAFFIKVNSRTLTVASDADMELLSKIKAGEPVRMTFTRPRNYLFHRKFFSLITFAFDYWTPPENHVAAPNLDRFRKDITILAGYYERSVRLDGSTRVEAKSISFASMGEDEFEKLYSSCIDVIIKRICHQFTGEMLRQTVELAEGFE